MAGAGGGGGRRGRGGGCFYLPPTNTFLLIQHHTWENHAAHPTILRAMQVGDRITGGDIYAIVKENSLMDHKVLLPPGARGNVSYIAPAGQYTIDEEVIEVEFQGTKKVRTGGRTPHAPTASLWPCAARRGVVPPRRSGAVAWQSNARQG